MPTCPACGSPNPDNTQICQACGIQLNVKPTEQAAAFYQPVVTPSPAVQVPSASPTPPPVSRPVYVDQPPAKQKMIAYALEFIPGTFGIIGLGRLYAGDTSAGTILLVISIIYTVISIGLAVLTVGWSCGCTPLVLILFLIADMINFYKYINKRPEVFGY